MYLLTFSNFIYTFYAEKELECNRKEARVIKVIVLK